ncbi:MAG: DNA replication and repair protein RecF [Alphaproteobacteria bacterium]
MSNYSPAKPPHLTSPRRGGESRAAFTVAATVINAHGEAHIGLGRDPDAMIEKRILKINGEKQRGQKALPEHVAIQWLTPAMDQVFVEGGSARRRLLDRIVYNFNPEHAAHVSAYEHAMRERNRLLTDRGRADLYWLSVLEQQMAEHGVAITLARLETLERLAPLLAEGLAGFPAARLSLEGTLEAWLAQGTSALGVEGRFAERLMDLRIADAVATRATEGPQRSFLKVVHSVNGRVAEQCSTGEQKALLLSLVLGAARARAQWCGSPPILLLDEVVAHLDVDKRGQLFDLIRSTHVQAWMSGVEAADFQGLGDDARHVEIDGGTAVMC